ncbi:hypothetical protein IU449_13095 [Nocardia higoensis]|uniref:Uncharacterized protein n=1 Tax=Nocardia higoensis TaxID=228599 RepID=A0ABS0DFK5_9NOCA|nr:hypothetical protein [Nocardia higoensis]MBF6355468.1 hypothetical protein [Nocardia higoensis]
MTVENEQPRISDPENPDGFTHTEINDAFGPLTPAAQAQPAADQYGQIAQLWQEGVSVFAAQLRRSSAAAWEGAAAEQSREAIGNYATRAEELGDALHLLGVRVDQTVGSIIRTQTNLPEVLESKPWYNPASWPWVGSNNSGKRSDAEEQARQVMNQYYVTEFAEADRTIPVLPTPISPLAPLHGDLPEGGTPGPGATSGPGGGTGSPSGPGTPGTDPAGEDPGSDDQPAGQDDPAQEPDGQDSDGQDSEPSGTTDPGDTTEPSGLTQPSGLLPDGTNPSGTNPGSGTPSSPGSPGGSPSSPGGSPVGPGAGRSIPGVPGAVNVPAATAATSTTAAASGRSGTPGMMAPGAGRGQQGSDDEHKIPDYLITAENTAELLGDPPPALPGGVIGADEPPLPA